MKILILTLGSRGDVQPYLALAVGLQRAGHRLTLAYALLAPFVPGTRAFPTFLPPLRFSLGRAYNRLTYGLMLRAGWPALAGPLNAWRAETLGRPPWRSIEQLLWEQRELGAVWLYGFSPSALPQPDDWPERHHVTGYWFLAPPAEWQPPGDLLRFLDAGPPPVYVGYGSLRPADAGRLTGVVRRALALSEQRGVLLAGGLVREAATPNEFYVDDVPHGWLFPQMRAVVHHGGAGTTGAGLRAGVPSVITPFLGDQYAWAELVAKHGAVPRVGPANKLTAEKLARAIDRAVNDEAMRARAAALGARIGAEDGVGAAIKLIEAQAAGGQGLKRFLGWATKEERIP
jgi:sterol 3beta-glucosyltransferase